MTRTPTLAIALLIFALLTVLSGCGASPVLLDSGEPDAGRVVDAGDDINDGGGDGGMDDEALFACVIGWWARIENECNFVYCDRAIPPPECAYDDCRFRRVAVYAEDSSSLTITVHYSDDAQTFTGVDPREGPFLVEDGVLHTPLTTSDHSFAAECNDEELRHSSGVVAERADPVWAARWQAAWESGVWTAVPY